MRELWRKTADIFWEYPILWLPVLAADLLGWCVTQVQGFLTHRIVLLLVERHSVLGNTPDPIAYQPSAVMKAALLTAPFVWGSYFINICVYTMAFIVTARLVFNFLHSHPTDLRFVIASEARHPRRIFNFAWKLFGMFVLAAILLWLMGQFAVGIYLISFLKVPVFAVGAAILVYACITYCLIPSSLKLVRQPESLPLMPEAIRLGRTIAIPVILALPVIAFCVQGAEQALLGKSPVHPMIRLELGAIASLVAAFAYVPLFIALSLVATQDEEAPFSMQKAN